MPSDGRGGRMALVDLTRSETILCTTVGIGWVVTILGDHLGHPIIVFVGALAMGFAGGWAMGYFQAEIDLADAEDDAP